MRGPRPAAPESRPARPSRFWGSRSIPDLGRWRRESGRPVLALPTPGESQTEQPTAGKYTKRTAGKQVFTSKQFVDLSELFSSRRLFNGCSRRVDYIRSAFVEQNVEVTCWKENFSFGCTSSLTVQPPGSIQISALSCS
jgi:hypothetical protein